MGIAQRNCMALPRDQLGCEGYHGYTLILLTALQPKQKQQKQPWNDKSRQLVRLFTVPYFFVRSSRYSGSFNDSHLGFQMYRGGGRRGL